MELENRLINSPRVVSSKGERTFYAEMNKNPERTKDRNYDQQSSWNDGEQWMESTWQDGAHWENSPWSNGP